MPSANKFVDDLSRVLSGAAGVAQGAMSEAEAAMRRRMNKNPSGDLEISREEFDAVVDMAKKARAENAALRKEVEELRAELRGEKPAAKATAKPAAKPKSTTTKAKTTKSTKSKD